DVRCSRLSTRVVVLRIFDGVCRGGAGALVLHPPLYDSLSAFADGQRPGRDVVADRRTSAGIGAITDGHGGHEHIIRAGARVPAHLRARFGETVVIGHDRAGADIGALADIGVADI